MINAEYWIANRQMDAEGRRSVEEFVKKNEYSISEKKTPNGFGSPASYLVIVAPWDLGVLWNIQPYGHGNPSEFHVRVNGQELHVNNVHEEDSSELEEVVD